MTKFKETIVSIIDYGMGNLFSVKRSCEHVGLKVAITSNKKDVMNADAVILPGVGAFGDAMKVLKKSDLISPILDFIKSGKPFMGICLGMQLLMSESEEFGKHKGLNIISGHVVKFPIKTNGSVANKVPQVGWNQIHMLPSRKHALWNKSPLSCINNREFMYFVHSYYCIPNDKNIILSLTSYADIKYCSSILFKNIFVCQFHPEKSAIEGLKIYKNWSLLIKKTRGEISDGKKVRS